MSITARRVSFFVPRMLQALAWIPTRLALNFFSRFEVRGLDNVLEYPHQPILFVANHGSELDPIAIRAALPLFWSHAPLCYVTAPLKIFADSVFSWRSKLYSSSWFFALWAAYPSTPNTRSYAEALKLHASLMQEDGACFLIFPEGKRTDPTKEDPVFHGGAGYLASLEGVVTIPVSVTGFRNTTPWNFLKGRHKGMVQFGTPRDIPPSSNTAEFYQSQVASVMEEVYEKMNIRNK